LSKIKRYLRRRYQVLSCIIFLLFIATHISAQKDTEPRITVSFKQVPVEQLMLELEKQSGYRFFYDPASFDSLKIDIEIKNEPLSKALSLAFANTPLVFSIDNERQVFITKNILVKTTLPEGWLPVAGDKKKELADDTLAVTNFETVQEKQERATLENKVYIIGTPAAANNSDKVTISGYVRDVKTGEPLIGVVIYIEGVPSAVITDQYGYFAASVNKGRHVLNIKSIGMRDTRRLVSVYSDGRMNIDLQSEVLSLKNVTVTSNRTNQVRNTQMGIQRLAVKTIKQVPVVFGESDVLRVVMTLPGVKTVGEASTGLNVRGGASDQNLILFNEATVYNPSHLFGLFSAFNTEIIKDVQLYKSGIPVKYGGRLSSVLEINSREGNKKEISGSAGIGLITSRFNIEGPLEKDKSSFIVGGRTTYANWLMNLLPREYKNSRASFYDINLHLSHEINKNNNLYFSGYLSHDGFNLNNDTAYTYGNRNFSVKWKHVFNNKWYSVVSSGIDHYQYGISSEHKPATAYKLSFDVNQAYLKTHFNYFVNATHSIEFGANSLLYKIHPGAYQPAGPASLIVPKNIEAEQALESAVYLSDKYSPVDAFSIEAGVRFSVFNYLGPKTINNYVAGLPVTETNKSGTSGYAGGAFIKTYQGPEYRVSARYAINNDLSVKASYNTQRQYIQALSNTTAIAPTDIWKLSDPNIKPQSGDQFSLGLYKNFKSGTIEISLEGYYKRMKGFLDYKSGAVLVLNSHIETDVVSANGKAYGVEFLLKKTTGKLNGWISYTYSRTLLQVNDSTLGDVVNKGEYYPANYDKPHDFSFAGNLKISHRYSTSLNATYSTGRPITLPLGRYNYAGGGRTLYADRNAYRIPDYFRIDVAMTLDGNHKVNQKFHSWFTFGAYNVLGRKNPYSVYYISENGAINGYKLSIFGSIIPYINYNVRF
jgi:hypothetical protein